MVELKMKYKSCKDLEKSIYLAPNEIRSCCQRFFFKGKMRGDAKLLDIDKKNSPKPSDIQKGRKVLFEDIQKDKVESCLGCPHLYDRSDKPNFTSDIDHLSIEHHSFCNLRCNYCSEIYYGGKKSNYDVIEFIKNLSENKSFKNCKQVVWGGGEPTLDKSFEIIVKEIDKYANPKIYHRVFTNSVRYHNAVYEFLKRGLIKIVTSIDAGTEETFKKVRGRNKFFNVFENLSRYAKGNSNSITVKYIFTEDNYSENELIKFVENCVQYNLNNCCFQISMNFKYNKIDINILKSIAFLMGEFKKNNISKFFCDDHIAARFKKLEMADIIEIKQYLNKRKINNILINNENLKSINIYGAGDIAKNIITKIFSEENKNQVELFDSDPKKFGKSLCGLKIKSPEDILANNNKIYISATQGYDEIYRKLIKLNVDRKRFISGLFI